MHWIQRHQRFLLFFLCIWAFAGILSITSIPVALFPNVAFPHIKVEVNTVYQSPEQMMTSVTIPIEEVLRSLPNILHVKSESARSGAEFIAVFSWGTNMNMALVEATSAMSQALPNLPPGTTFNATRMTPAIDPIFGINLYAKKQSLVTLRNLALYQIRPLLASIPGVKRIQVLGGQEEEFHIIVDPEKLHYYQLTWQEVQSTLTHNLSNRAGGRIEDSKKLYLILLKTPLESLKNLEEIPLKKSQNQIVLLRDIAQIKKAPKLQWQTVRADGQDAILINIMQQNNANTVKIINEVQNRLKEIRAKIPDDIVLKPYYDQSYIILNSALSVRDAIIIGALLAALILWLFLRNRHAMFVIGLLVIATLSATILLIKILGLSFNVMTLGGLAAAVGLIIDDNVVVLENLMAYLEKNRAETIPIPYYQATQTPLSGSSLATMIIFIPLAFLSGVTGGFFKDLALTMTLSLSASYLFVLLTMPTVGIYLQKYAKDLSHEPPQWIILLHQYYTRMMWHCLKKPLTVLITLAGLIGVGFLAYEYLGTGFLPPMDEGGFVLNYKATPGTSVIEANKLAYKVEKIVQKLPYVKSYARRMGLQMGGGLTAPTEGDMSILLTNKKRPPIETIMANLQNQVQTEVPELQVDTAQLMEDLIGDLTGNPQPVAIKLFSSSFQQLQHIAPKVARSLKKIPGIVSVKNGLKRLGNTWSFEIDPIKSYIFSSEPTQITQQLQEMVEGKVLFKTFANEHPINIRLWSSLHKGNPDQTFASFFVGHAPFASVGTSSATDQTLAITREDFSPLTTVTTRIEGRDLGSTMKDVKQKISALAIPESVRIEYGGLYKQQEESFVELTLVFLSGLLLLMALLLYLYENYFIMASISFAIILSLPFVFFGLWITHTELNISSLMGITMITGMIAEMAIFYFSEIQKEKNITKETLIKIGIKRMRPILMSSLIAILALLPLALGQSMQAPLSISIISGLVIAIPMVLVFMPCLYSFLKHRQLGVLGE